MSTSTWNRQPASGEWNDASNWTPAGVPTDTASFSQSSQTSLSFSPTGNATVGQLEFIEGASGYTFNFGTSMAPGLTITGTGVSNQSAAQQSFIVAATTPGHDNPQLKFTNSATAGADNVYYCAGPVSESGYGGGVISFCNQSNAGSASFKVWTGAAKPQDPSTVGGEVSFSDTTSAATARFTIYGTLGSDGDTFGNVVFHDKATAANGTFTNVGGTVSGGDGGNTQFYDQSTAANGNFYNWGGTYTVTQDSPNGGGNGGDVAFDGTVTGGQGRFYNYAAQAKGSYGGVTSFNNN